MGRVIQEVGLRGLNEELVARRRGNENGPASLRSLAHYFNREVLRRAIERAGNDPLEGEVENLHRLLTDDEVSSGTGIRVRKQLQSDGVDVDAVEANFVSHPTMGRHLEECLGVERSVSGRDRIQTATERIFKMQSRAEAVIGNTLAGLASTDRVTAGDLAVTVDVQVTCQTCGVHGSVEEFIERGGCDCEPGEER